MQNISNEVLNKNIRKYDTKLSAEMQNTLEMQQMNLTNEPILGKQCLHQCDEEEKKKTARHEMK